MRYRFALGLLLGAAGAVLILDHAGPVELALLHGSIQVSSAVVHLLLIVCGLLIGWILRDDHEAGRGARDRGLGHDAS